MPASSRLPVVRVPVEDQPLARLVARASLNGPITASSVGGVATFQASRNVPAVERRLQLVPRHDRQVVEQADARPERRRVDDDDGAGIRRADVQRLAADQQRGGQALCARGS